VIGSENADMSSDSPVENTGCRKPKVSEATSFGFGSVDTKGSTNGGFRCTSRQYSTTLFLTLSLRFLTKFDNPALLYGGLNYEFCRKAKRVINAILSQDGKVG
jgi:hypothetical protein